MSGMVLITQEEYDELKGKVKLLEEKVENLESQEYYQCYKCRYLNLQYRTECRNCGEVIIKYGESRVERLE